MDALDSLYGWPVEKSVLEGFSHLESPVHRNVPKLSLAFDFMVPLGSSVIAMADGEVTYVKQDSTEGGSDLDNVHTPCDSKFFNHGNRIEIHHGREIYTAYEHLAYDSSVVQEGDSVKKYDLLALTGYTGEMAHLGPHVHIERYQWYGPGDNDYLTLPIHWENEIELWNFFWDRKKWKDIGNSRVLHDE